jgi:hypothetical protein
MKKELNKLVEMTLKFSKGILTMYSFMCVEVK